MITQKSIQCYRGTALSRGNDFLYIPPHTLLRPYISCYTITFPQAMPDAYTVLPSASATLVFSVDGNTVGGGLCGARTRANTVGVHANQMTFLLLIEFHSGCLYPFIPVPQMELANLSFGLDALDKTLAQEIEKEVIKSESIEALSNTLDKILLALLKDSQGRRTMTAMMNHIAVQNGNLSMKALSSAFHYSEKHIRRLFLQYAGTSPKMFSRIVRVNHTLRLLQQQQNFPSLTDVAVQAGFFDQPHFIHDFQSICGLTPQEYLRNMSLFYNDAYKM